MGTPTAAEHAPAPPPKISHDRLTLCALLIALVAPFRAQKDIRWYLNGINVRPHPEGGAVIAATNGHMLGAVYDRAAVCDHEVTLTLSAATVAACAARPRESRELKMVGGRLVVMGAAGEIHIQPGNPEITGAEYPRYENILPDASRLVQGMIGHYHSGYLALLDQVSTIAQRTKTTSRPATFFTLDGQPSTNVVARLPAIPDFVALLMPQYERDAIDPLPAWVRAAAKKSDISAPAKAAA